MSKCILVVEDQEVTGGYCESCLATPGMNSSKSKAVRMPWPRSDLTAQI
jgi:hypothetical protein